MMDLDVYTKNKNSINIFFILTILKFYDLYVLLQIVCSTLSETVPMRQNSQAARIIRGYCLNKHDSCFSWIYMCCLSLHTPFYPTF